MTIDPVKNFAKVTLSTGYDNTAITVILIAGDGAKLPVPGTDGAFNLVYWNSTDYSDPTDDPNREIVRVTAITADTLTIVRAQEGTSASTKNTSGKTYQMILAITKKTIDDLRTATSGEAWIFDYQPPQQVNGSNLVFTIPVPASQVVVHADGFRMKGSGIDYTFSAGNTITFGVQEVPESQVSIDYLPS